MLVCKRWLESGRGEIKGCDRHWEVSTSQQHFFRYVVGTTRTSVNDHTHAPFLKKQSILNYSTNPLTLPISYIHAHVYMYTGTCKMCCLDW